MARALLLRVALAAEEPNDATDRYDVWEVGVKMGWASGPYDPRSNGIAARADAVVSLQQHN